MKALALVFLVGLGACVLQASECDGVAAHDQSVLLERAWQQADISWWKAAKDFYDAIAVQEKVYPGSCHEQICAIVKVMDSRNPQLANLATGLSREKFFELPGLHVNPLLLSRD